MSLVIFIRGGGDLASGVALRLHRAGLRLLITELPQPLVVRRAVSFASAVYQGKAAVEGIMALRAKHFQQALAIMEGGNIPVLVDPDFASLSALRSTLSASTPVVLVDGRMIKRPVEYSLEAANLIVGLGPGFAAGQNCHAVVETNRGHRLGRVIWDGAPEADTGIPDPVNQFAAERVIRSPADGLLLAHAEIGDHLEPGQIVAEVDVQSIYAPLRGVLRGLLYPGLRVWRGMKIGDIDPRDDPNHCFLVSDKSLAVGGGVLEAILSRPELRPYFWD
jgi:xanthine dehydrogenase accessory factor